MKTSNEVPLKQAIEQMLEAFQLKGKINEVKVVNSWETAVGRYVAERTEKIYMHKGKLYVQLTSAAIKNDILYTRHEIIKRLNELVGENTVEDIVVK